MNATAPHGHRNLFDEFRANFNLRRVSLAVGISLVISTQLLFQESVVEQFSFAETFDGLWPYFLDILTIAILLSGGVAFVDARFPAESARRAIALAAVVFAAIVIGGGIQLGVHYGFGPFPPTSSILGEATRWLMISAAITLIYESTRRRKRHLRQLHAAELRPTSRGAISKPRPPLLALLAKGHHPCSSKA